MKKSILLASLVLSLISCKRELKIINERYPDGKEKAVSYYLNDTSLINKKLTVYFYPKGQKKYELPFSNGKKNGRFINYYSNGNIEHEGIFVNDTIEGLVKYFFNDSLSKIDVERFYKKGELYHEMYYYQNGNKMIEGYYKHHVSCGPYRVWYPNGKLNIEDTDCWNGIETEFYSNGAKKAQGRLLNGKEYGLWECWDSLGNSLGKVPNYHVNFDGK